ncbi:MAG: glutaredoxin family protein [Mariprofundaceae bacterium]
MSKRAEAPLVQVMSRRDCCLCEDAKAVVREARDAGLCRMEVVDVDRDKALLVRYGLDVPVILIDGEEHARHRLDPVAFRHALAAGEGA